MTDRGIMRHFRLIIRCSFIAVCLLFFACGSDSTTGAPNPRTLTLAIKNLKATDAVHVYFETGQPGPDNLVNPQSSIQTIILAHGVGHIFSVYVDDAADPGGTALLTINVEVTATSYNSGTAELQWTGTDLLGIG